MYSKAICLCLEIVLSGKVNNAQGKQLQWLLCVGLLNENDGSVDKAMSICQLLKTPKIDMSWIDFCVWSPTACLELKRLITQMSNKRKKKPIPAHAQAQAQSQSQTQQETWANSITADSNTHFLSSLLGVDKAFRIPCSIQIPGQNMVTTLDRSQVQANQGSDMSVISTAMTKQLGLVINPLSDIGFAGLTMRTADHRETLLHSWVYLDIEVADISRTIRCFVAPKQSSPSFQEERLSLLLGIPWLYSVNAKIAIRGSRIAIGDPATGEAVRDIVRPLLVFCKDHNLIMYPKEILAAQSLEESDDDSDSEDSDGSVSLSNDEEFPAKGPLQNINKWI